MPSKQGQFSMDGSTSLPPRKKIEHVQFPLSLRTPSALFYYHGLTLIPAWISNYMPRKVWGEITAGIKVKPC